MHTDAINDGADVVVSISGKIGAQVLPKLPHMLWGASLIEGSPHDAQCLAPGVPTLPQVGTHLRGMCTLAIAKFF